MKKLLLFFFFSCLLIDVVAGPTLTQSSWRWRNDNGSETSATWKGNENQEVTVNAADGNIRLRMKVSSTANPDNYNFGNSIDNRLSYSTSASGPFSIISSTSTNGEHFVLDASTGVQSGTGTTQQLSVDFGVPYVPGKVIDSTTPEGYLEFNDETNVREFEWVLKPTAAAVDGKYYFKLDDPSISTPNTLPSITYSTTPESKPIAGYRNALQFDGVNDYVEIPSQASNQFDSETEFTVSLWFKANSMATAGLFNRPAGGGDMQYWLTAGDGKFTYGIDKLGWGWTWIGTEDAYKVGEWVQVTTVRRNVSGQRKMEIYANGVLVGSGTVNYTSSASSAPIRIGTYMNADGGFANGQIDNVSLWKKALTVEEIKTLGATTLNGNEAGLAGYWRFDETTGTIAYDATANANHGTLNNMDLAAARLASTAGDISTNEDVAYTGKLAGSDESGNALIYAIVTAPTKGTLTLTDAATGAFTYTPATNINGTDVFTYNVNNGSSDSETATVNVTIVAVNDAPVAAAKPLTADADANCQAVIAASAFNNNSSDIDGDALTFTASPAGPYTVGVTNVTLTVTDGKGGSSTAATTITIADKINPTITAPVAVTVNTDAGKNTASEVALGTAVTADNCSVASTTNDAPVTFPVGNTTVTWTVTDAAGNSATATQLVTVTDNEKPVPTIATLPTITGQCSATVTAPTATDNVSGTVTGTTIDPLEYTEQGTYTITWTYTDGAGNTATQTQQVIVKDETAPVFAAVSPITKDTDLDKCGALVTYTIPAATDNCISAGAIDKQTFSYTGSVQTFIVPVTGKYILETWGSQGGNDTQIPNSQFGGRGGYSKGEVTLTAGTTLYIYVGGQGTGNASTSYWGSTGGGGATDIRLVGGAWNDNAGLYSRIIVAGGGGGRHGGNYEDSSTGNVGNDGGGVNAPSFTTQGVNIIGASQTAGGASNYSVAIPGSFGFGNHNNYSNTSSVGGWNGGGRGSDGFANGGAGGGWYGGVSTWPTSSGGSGYVLTADSYKPAGYTPTSEYYMNEAELIAGNATMPNHEGGEMVGRTGNGIAVISWENKTVTVTQTAGLASGALFPVGTTTNTFVATDAVGNTSTTSFDVTVTDTQKPTVITQNITVNLDATGAATITAAQINNGSTDNCSIPAEGYSLDKTGFTCDNVGPNTVTLTVTDVNGNTSSATAIVTVKDVTAPIAIAKAITVQLDANGAATITPAMVDNGSSDICGSVTLSLSKTTFDCSNLGTNTVTLTATDEAGNVATTTAIITVEDKVAPVAIAQDITVQLDATGNATITAAQVNNGSSDACGDITLTISKTAFDCSNVGENSVTLTVTDKSGNTHTTTAIVTVEDKVAPVVITQNITVQLDAAGNATITADEVNNGSADACGIKSMSLSKTTFDCSTIGANTVTLTVTDNNGNVATKTAIVTVEDKIAPIALTKNITIKLDAAGKATIVAADVDNGSSDVCGSVKLTIDKAAFDCSNIGENEVMLTVTDAYDNVATEKATVTVVDDLVPVVLTQNITVSLDATGNATITTVQIDNGSSDNCGIASYKLDKAEFGCAHLGENTVTLTVTDVNGNVAKKGAIVTIVDEIAPTALARNITVELDANGSVTLTAAQVNDNSTDNCGVATLTLDKDTFGCSNLGENTVNLTVTDKAGNTAIAAATVTIVDHIAPTITAPADVVVDVDAGKTTASNVDLGTPVTADNCDAAAIDVTNDAPTHYPAGTTTVTWTATDASGNKTTATQTVTVRQDIASVATLATITVPIRTAFASVPLPATVAVTYTNGEQEAIGVTWAAGTYNGLVAGTYVLSGQLIAAPNTTNQSSKTATITVVVEPNKVPTALAFSATTFAPNVQADDVIGTLTTTDPDDTQFVYTLVAGSGDSDNSLFEISGDKVYLKSNNGLSGKTTFSFRVRSTDPYQNTIEKAFTLTKGNYGVAVDKLKIVNAFSPNGDGINDSWSIPELRFYNQVEVEVFDRSGVRLFHTTDPEMAWDGRSANGQVLQGAFFYIVQVRDINLVKKGVVTILKK
ncbi:glycine-rich protein [Pontibacter pudoricolor]|uniref:glycine-rich protein n=1 Tax=Pontibacter pudoricolor TaxID=2694930 RepID=UPI00139155D8|nr:glycine-rich protein [Pontibacter pudoricolor]